MGSCRNLWRLAVRELVSPPVRKLSLFLAASVACTTALAILVLGALWGFEAISRFRVATGMVVGDPRFEEFRLTQEQVQAKENEMRSSLKDPAVLGGIHPFVEVVGECFTLDSANSKTYRTVIGRTIGANDPMLQSIIFPATTNQPLASPELLIVSPRFLEELGIPPGGERPNTIRVRRIGQASGAGIELPILVAEHDFSARWSFLIVESHLRKLEAANADIATRRARVRPVPVKWRKSTLPNSVRDLLQDHGVDEGWRIEGALEFTSIRAMRRENWLALCDEIRNELRGYKEFEDIDNCFSPGLLELVPDSNDNTQQVPETVYDYVYIHTTRPDAIEELMSAAKPLPADPELSAKVNQLASLAQLGQMLRWMIPAMLVLTGLINLWAIQQLRDSTKVYEIGLLKAMGMSERQLLWLFIMEAFLVGMVGILVGASASYPIGYAVRELLAATPQEHEQAFFWRGAAAISGAVALVVVVAAAIMGTRGSRRQPPIESFCAN